MPRPLPANRREYPKIINFFPVSLPTPVLLHNTGHASRPSGCLLVQCCSRKDCASLPSNQHVLTACTPANSSCKVHLWLACVVHCQRCRTSGEGCGAYPPHGSVASVNSPKRGGMWPSCSGGINLGLSMFTFVRIWE